MSKLMYGILLAGLMAVPLAADTPTADTPGDNPSSEKSKGYMTADGIYVPPDRPASQQDDVLLRMPKRDNAEQPGSQ
jgi:hypothetical protein